MRLSGRKRGSKDVFVLGEEGLDEPAAGNAVLVAEPPDSPSEATVTGPLEPLESVEAIDFDEELFCLGDAQEPAESSEDAVGATEPMGATQRAPARWRGALGGLALGVAGVAIVAALVAASQPAGRAGETTSPAHGAAVATKPAEKTPERGSRPRRTRDRERDRAEPQPVASSSTAPSAPAPSAPVVASPSPPSQGGGSGGRETFGIER